MSKTTKPKSGQAKTAMRREELRRHLPKPTFDPKVLLEKPEFVNAMLISLALVLVAGALVIWGREQVLVRDGQIMTATRLKRLDYLVADDAATETKREEARRSAPRIYRLNEAYITRLEAALQGLPKAVAGKTSVDTEISAELRDSFDLTDAGLVALQAMTTDGEAVPEWNRHVDRLINGQLRLNPLIASQEYQVFSTTPTLNRALLGPTGLERPLRGDAIELIPDSTNLQLRLNELVTYAGFPPQVAPFVLARLNWQPQPTLQFDQTETQRYEDDRAAAVEPVMIEHKAGEILYQRGDELSPAQYDDVLKEADYFAAYAPPADLWLPRLGIFGLIGILVAFLSVHIFAAHLRIVRNALRMTALALLMGGMLAITVLVAAETPSFMFPATIAPTLFVAVVMLLAYDQRLALFVSGTQCALVVLAINQTVGWFVLLIAGCGTFVAQLHDVRHRSSLIRAATVTAAVLALAALLLGILTTPLVPGAWNQILWRAAAAALSSFAVDSSSWAYSPPSNGSST